MVDIESDGPIPGDYSMICFGAVVVDAQLDKTFFRKLKPISDRWIPKTLEISGYTRDETLTLADPSIVMFELRDWLREVTTEKPVFVSDNNGFDWSFINWYFHHFVGENPFGYSSVSLGSLYKGLVADMS